MKRTVTITFIVSVMGIAGLSGFACSMEKLDDTAQKTTIESEKIDPMIKAIEEDISGPADAEDTGFIAEEEDVTGEENTFEIEAASEEMIPSGELVRLSWEASSKRNLDRLNALVDQCVATYGVQAKALQSELLDFPARGLEEQYHELNNVGTCLFIKAEAVMNSGKSAEAIKQFEHIIKEYPWAQAWDPRGWFWSVAEKSQNSIDGLTGKAEEDFVQQTERVKLIKPQIYAPGTEKIVDYSKYGTFQNVGKEKYFYRMHDPDGLSKAIGEGIYPNTGAIYNNPRYKIVKEEGRLEIGRASCRERV